MLYESVKLDEKDLRLYRAIREMDFKLATELINSGSNINAIDSNSGLTIMNLILGNAGIKDIKSKKEMLDYLIENNATDDYAYYDEKEPKYFPIMYLLQLIHLGVLNQDETIDLMLKFPKDWFNKHFPNDRNVLMFLTSRDITEKSFELLIDKFEGDILDSVDYIGNSVLSLTVLFDKLSFAKRLVLKGININLKNKDKLSAFDIALQKIAANSKNKNELLDFCELMIEKKYEFSEISIENGKPVGRLNDFIKLEKEREADISKIISNLEPNNKMLLSLIHEDIKMIEKRLKESEVVDLLKTKPQNKEVYLRYAAVSNRKDVVEYLIKLLKPFNYDECSQTFKSFIENDCESDIVQVFKNSIEKGSEQENNYYDLDNIIDKNIEEINSLFEKGAYIDLNYAIFSYLAAKNKNMSEEILSKMMQVILLFIDFADKNQINEFDDDGEDYGYNPLQKALGANVKDLSLKLLDKNVELNFVYQPDEYNFGNKFVYRDIFNIAIDAGNDIEVLEKIIVKMKDYLPNFEIGDYWKYYAKRIVLRDDAKLVILLLKKYGFDVNENADEVIDLLIRTKKGEFIKEIYKIPAIEIREIFIKKITHYIKDEMFDSLKNLLLVIKADNVFNPNELKSIVSKVIDPQNMDDVTNILTNTGFDTEEIQQKVFPHIKLTNYKSFKQMSRPMEIKPLTLLCGKNSCGKSSIIKSILFIKQSISEHNMGEEFVVNGIYTDIGLLKNVTYNGNMEPSTLSFSDGETIFEVCISPRGYENIYYNKKDSPYIRHFLIDWKSKTSSERKQIKVYNRYFNSRHNLRFRYDEGLNSEHISFILEPEPIDCLDLGVFFGNLGMKYEKNYYFKTDEDIISEINLGGTKYYNFVQKDFFNKEQQSLKFDRKNAANNIFGEELTEAKRKVKEMFNKIIYLGPLRQKPQRKYISNCVVNDVGINGEKSIFLLSQFSTLQTELLQAWLKNMQMNYVFAQKNSEDPEVLYFRVQSNKNYNADLIDVGFGYSQVLPILIQGIALEEGETLIIEQPELHLHPEMQMHLADFFIDLIKRGKKIIIETHSEHIINRIVRRMLEDKDNKIKDQTSIYFIENASAADGANFKEIELDGDCGIKNWPDGFFDQASNEKDQMLKNILRNFKNDKNSN
ncbi:MAG TPA: DUF3696 domain-containing protein [Candidatus Goldiibacteriota bacterium]|nr:DUF3696 domain-containing protein [Candidatus Goldiibacteriota bacterium]